MDVSGEGFGCLNFIADIPQVAATYAAINLNYSIHGALKQINAM
jgi:hypothetical protein